MHCSLEGQDPETYFADPEESRYGEDVNYPGETDIPVFTNGVKVTILNITEEMHLRMMKRYMCYGNPSIHLERR